MTPPDSEFSEESPGTNPSMGNFSEYPAEEAMTAAIEAPTMKMPSLLRSASLIALITMLSKVLGAVRDWAIMHVYGTSLPSDAYFAAAQIPSFAIILLGGLGGPFHTATVAIFSKLIHDDGPPSSHAKRLASTFITITGVVFLILSILTYVYARPILGLILHGSPAALVENATVQLRILTPVIFVGGLVGILYGILNVYHSFLWPSLSPAVLSLAMIVTLLLNSSDKTGHILAYSMMIGAVGQFALQLPEYFKRGYSLKPAWAWNMPELKALGEMLFPAMIGTTIGQLNVYVDMFFTSLLPIGGWTAIVMGNRLIQLPIGVLQTALLVPIFPRFTRYAADGQLDELKRTFKMGVVSLWMISFPLLVILLLYREPFIRIVFQHGRFTARGTTLISDALLGLTFQMIPYFARDSITRVFYAFQDSKTPLIVGLIAILTNAFFDWLLVGPYGVGGITFSTTIVTFINMCLLGILSKRHIRDLGFREMIAPFLKLALAASAMAGVLILLNHSPLGSLFSGLQLTGEFIRVTLFSLAGLAVFALCAYLLRVAEAHYLLEIISRRFLKQKG